MAAAPDQPGWYPDPALVHEKRYYDGKTWTEHVTDQGRPGTDPYREPFAGPAAPRAATTGPAPVAPGPAPQKPGMSNTVKTLLSAGAVIVVLIIVAAIAGGSSDNNDSKTEKTTAVAASAPTPVASADSSADSGPAEEEPAPVVPKPDGEYNFNCDYVLGDFGDSGDPVKGFRFIGGGTMKNTGNIGIRVQVKFKWKRLGTDPVIETKTYRLPRKRTRDVNVTLPATQNDIDLHQSADGDCTAKATMIGTFGKAAD